MTELLKLPVGQCHDDVIDVVSHAIECRQARDGIRIELCDGTVSFNSDRCFLPVDLAHGSVVRRYRDNKPLPIVIVESRYGNDRSRVEIDR